mgnify:FL=1
MYMYLCHWFHWLIYFGPTSHAFYVSHWFMPRNYYLCNLQPSSCYLVYQYQWVSGLGANNGHLGDLQQYASLFTNHNINGKRLLQMGLDDLKAIGISSHGHLSDIMVNVFESNHPIIALSPGRVQNSAIYGLLKKQEFSPHAIWK